MQNNAVGWFEIYVDDMKRAQAFYEAVFKTKLEQLEAPEGPLMMAFGMNDQAYGAPGALVKMDGFSPGGNSTLVYFSCEDCAVEAKRAGENKGKVVQEKMSIGQYGFIALVTDTEGNMIGLHSMQ